MGACLFAVLLVMAGTACFGNAPIAQEVSQEVKWGTVEGIVVGGDSKPLPGATVTSYTQAKGVERDVMQYETNSNGEFSLRLPAGRVWLSAHKNSEGYPYAFFAFYIMPGQEFPTVEVKPGETIKDVVVRVGVKAAHLNYEVLNQEGEEVLGGFVFERLDQPTLYRTSALARDDLLVPPTPFRVTFEAKGYKPWHYGGDKWRGKEGVISLKSGEVLNLRIRLQRE
jgi:Carboxypeptidase regulatory-like domain